MLRRSSALAVLAFLGSAAAAQENPSPQAVHECTGINDPRLMQECIQRNSGFDSRLAPGAGGDRGDKLLDDSGASGQESGPPP
ncbi:MAG: hypothetical protein ABSA66_06400 [Roseiarcus sp.]|jgi:hypothetical protein